MKPSIFTIFYTSVISVFYLVAPLPAATPLEQPAEFAEAASAKHRDRGLWVWQTAALFAGGDKSKDDFLEFLQNPLGSEQPINVVFLHVNRNMLKTKSTDIRAWARMLHENNIGLHLLDGDAQWAWQHGVPLTLVDAFVAYQKAAAPEERFDGFQFDIEPHVLPIYGITEYRDKLNARFVVLLQKASEKLRTEAPGTQFGLALAMGTEEDFLAELIQYIDYVAVMDYLDRPRGIIHHAEKFIDAGEANGKAIYIGVETQKPSQRWGVLASNTFFDEGASTMEAVLAQVAQAYQASPAFTGIAIHDYKNYRILPLEGERPIGTRVYPSLPTLEAIPIDQVEVDGVLDEWNIMNSDYAITLAEKRYVVYGRERRQGKEDYSATIQLGWDPQFLYLALAIADDKVLQDFTGLDMVTGDHIEILIDYDLQGDKEVNIMDNDDFQIGISPGNFAGVPPSLAYWFPDHIEEATLAKIQFAAQQTASGYTIEIALPWSLYPDFQPQAQQTLRINIDPSDTDDNPNVQETLLSTSPHRKLANPRTFRTLRLQ